MIGYVTVGTNDLDRAHAFYDALFESVGGKRLLQLDDQRGFTMYGVAMNRPGVVVTLRVPGSPLDGREASVLWLEDWGAHVACPAAGTGKYRAA